MISQQESRPEFPCPRCGADATWRYIDASKNIIEVLCCDCGPLKLSRAEFEMAESDVVEPIDRGD